MTKQTEALKMAHKSFMQLNERHPRKDNGNGYFDEEIQACKEALEQPAQEPVAWNEEEFNAIAYAYRAFPSSEVKMVSEKYKALVDYVLSIANHAPAWQGLTSEEIESLDLDNDVISVIFQTEMLLKEKNHV